MIKLILNFIMIIKNDEHTLKAPQAIMMVTQTLAHQQNNFSSGIQLFSINIEISIINLDIVRSKLCKCV